jgi:2-phosphosulfolactate phosphatase
MERERRDLVVDVVLAPSLLPAGLAARRPTVAIMVDVIRASTTLCVLFEQGCRRVYAAESIERARLAAREKGREALAASHGSLLLAGEVEGVAPPGFDYGNSPAECAALDLTAREVIFATTNGTRALHACADASVALVGALRNAAAVARAAVAHAGSGGAPDDGAGAAITIVCAGRGGLPAYDDTLCAGAIVAGIERAAWERGQSLALRDGAHIAAGVWANAAQGGVRGALAVCAAARAVITLGLERDLDWCAAVDACALVPAVTRRDDTSRGLLGVEPLLYST